jgi:hypothetical protein
MPPARRASKSPAPAARAKSPAKSPARANKSPARAKSPAKSPAAKKATPKSKATTPAVAPAEKKKVETPAEADARYAAVSQKSQKLQKEEDSQNKWTFIDWLLLTALVAVAAVAGGRFLSEARFAKHPPLARLSDKAFDKTRLKHAGGYKGSALVLFTTGGLTNEGCAECFTARHALREAQATLKDASLPLKFAWVRRHTSNRRVPARRSVPPQRVASLLATGRLRRARRAVHALRRHRRRGHGHGHAVRGVVPRRAGAEGRRGGAHRGGRAGVGQDRRAAALSRAA